MAFGLEKQSRRWTYEEYSQLDDDQRYELHCCAEERGKLDSLMVAGLEFDLSEVQ
jgi:hypothetical protein